MDREELIFWIFMFAMCAAVLALTLWTIFGG